MLILCLVKNFPPTIKGRPFVSGWGLSILWLMEIEVSSVLSSGLVQYLHCLYSRVRHNSEGVMGILNSQWKNRETTGQCKKA